MPLSCDQDGVNYINHMKNARPIEVAIVEDNQRYLEELGLLLTNSPGINVVGQFATGKDACKEICKLNPDVTLIDIGLPDISGVEIIERVSSQGCPTEFLVLTVYDDDSHLFSALQAGAVGYIIKGSTSLPEIESAIQEVVDGGAPMSRVIAKRVLETFRPSIRNSRKTKFDELTKREIQILEFIKRGYSTKKVAEELHISYETVRTHLKNIYQKLHVHTLVEAMLLYNQR
jgi:DNA-binding NarL/FixJ family response regulator